MNFPWNELLFKPNIINTLLVLIVIIVYRLRKRFKERPVDSLWAFLDHNVVEVIGFLLLTPRVAEHVTDLIHTLVRG